MGCAGPRAATAPLVAPGQLKYEDIKTTERFRKYEAIGIRPFSTEDVVFMSTSPNEMQEMETFRKTAPDLLLASFERGMKKNFYKRFGLVASDDDLASYDLVIEGEFSEFDRGNRAARYSVGFGSGSTHVSVSGRMFEPKTGNTVVIFRDALYGRWGLFGGSSMELLQRNCQDIGTNISDFLRDCY